MKINGLFIVWMTLMMGIPLRADSPDASLNDQVKKSAHLKKDQKHLERMEAERRTDNEHTRKAKEEFRKGTVELSGDDEQQLTNVRKLRSVETQVSAGQVHQNMARQSYKESVQKYGSVDPRSVAAKAYWKQSRLALDPLFESLNMANEDLYRGRLLVHNDKVVLSLQKRSMYSDSLYRASDDREILKMQKNITEDRKVMDQNGLLMAEPH